MEHWTLYWEPTESFCFPLLYHPVLCSTLVCKMRWAWNGEKKRESCLSGIQERKKIERRVFWLLPLRNVHEQGHYNVTKSIVHSQSVVLYYGISSHKRCVCLGASSSLKLAQVHEIVIERKMLVICEHLCSHYREFWVVPRIKRENEYAHSLTIVMYFPYVFFIHTTWSCFVSGDIYKM